MNIAILNLYDTGIEYYARFTEDMNRMYADKHGYRYIRHLGLLTRDRSPNWSKILLLLDSMDKYPDIDWFWWEDSDVIITDMEFKLETVIELANDEEIFLCSKLPTSFNTGSFLIRNCEVSKQFLRDVYAKEQFAYHHLSEEAAINYILLRGICTYKDNVLIIEPKLLNAGLNIWDDTCFVLHLYGNSFDEDIVHKYHNKYFKDK